MTKRPNFEIIADKWFELGGEMRKAATEWLKRLMRKHPYLYFGEMCESVSCCYNGGNNPETESNCFAIIYAVMYENGSITLEIDGCDAYDFDELSTEEVFELCDFIKNVYMPYKKEETKKEVGDY